MHLVVVVDERNFAEFAPSCFAQPNFRFRCVAADVIATCHSVCDASSGERTPGLASSRGNIVDERLNRLFLSRLRFFTSIWTM